MNIGIMTKWVKASIKNKQNILVSPEYLIILL